MEYGNDKTPYINEYVLANTISYFVNKHIMTFQNPKKYFIEFIVNNHQMFKYFVAFLLCCFFTLHSNIARGYDEDFFFIKISNILCLFRK